MNNYEIGEINCRVCLNVCNPDEANFTAEDASRYRSCTGFEFTTEDVPRKICGACSNLLSIFATFQLNCELVEERLREYFKMKVESLDPEEEDCTFEDTTVQVEEEVKEEVKPGLIKADVSLPKTRKPRKKGQLKRICDFCPQKKFTSRKALKNHMKRDHMQKVPRMKLMDCFYCVEVFNSAKARRAHINDIHRDRKERSYMCAKCGKIFRSIDYLKRHLECVHEKSEYFCDLCKTKQPILGKVRLYEHMRYHHLRPVSAGDKAIHACPHCGQKFNYSNTRRLHIMRNHMDKTMLPYHCTVCPTPRGFATKQAYEVHHRTHTGEKNFECHCGDKFGTRNHLKQHQTSVHEKTDATCEQCGKHFTSQRYLKQHAKTHDQTSYVCPMCPARSFSLTTTLRAHIKSNHPDLPLPPPGTILKNYNWSQHIPIKATVVQSPSHHFHFQII